MRQMRHFPRGEGWSAGDGSGGLGGYWTGIGVGMGLPRAGRGIPGPRVGSVAVAEEWVSFFARSLTRLEHGKNP